jgi:hypothetical protein
VNAHPVNSKGLMRIFGLNNQEDATTIKRELMYTEPDLRNGAFLFNLLFRVKLCGAASYSKVLRVVYIHITLTSGGPGREGSLWTFGSYGLFLSLLSPSPAVSCIPSG